MKRYTQEVQVFAKIAKAIVDEQCKQRGIDLDEREKGSIIKRLLILVEINEELKEKVGIGLSEKEATEVGEKLFNI